MKTITLYGWWVSFERDSDVYLKHEEVSGFSSIEKTEVDGSETPYKESDFTSVELGRIVTEYPNEHAPGLKRRKSDGCFTIKINAREFDPKKLQLHYADIVIKIGDEEIDTGNRIVWDITYNGRKCHQKWKSNGERKHQTVIWYKSPFIYDFLDFNEGLAAAELNGWCGYIDTNGRVAISFQYDSAEEFRNGFAPVELFDPNEREYKWGFVDRTGREVVPCEYDEVHHFFDGRAFVAKRCEFGFIDEKGNEIVPCSHLILRDYGGFTYYHYDFSQERAILCKKNSKECGYIDKNGKEITPLEYWGAKPFSEGFGAVRSKEGWGFVDKTGVEVIPCAYSDANSFYEGLAAVKINDRWGFIDKTNRLVIPCKYNKVGRFDEGLAPVKVSGKWGFIDKSGNRVIPCIYSDVGVFENGMATVRKDKKWGYIDRNGNIVVPCIYDHAENYKANGLACVSIDEKMGCIDRTGRFAIPLIYDCIANHETILVAELEEKWGFIDLESNPIEDFSVYKTLARKYDQVFINNGEVRTYSFALDGKYGLADADGNELIPPRYDWLGEGFYDGLCMAGYRGKDNGVGFINFKGEEVITPKQWTVSDFDNGIALVSYDDKKWGYINTNGEIIVPLKYVKLKRCVEVRKIVAFVDDGDIPTAFYDFEGNVIEP